MISRATSEANGKPSLASSRRTVVFPDPGPPEMTKRFGLLKDIPRSPRLHDRFRSGLKLPRLTHFVPLVLMTVGALCAANFRAAAVKVDITPTTPQVLLGYNPRTSTGVHDRIYHRVLVLDDGRTQFVLVASDLCLFSPELYDQLAAELAKSGIERKQFWWSVTHTHSAPEVGPPGVYKVLLKGRSDHEWDREYTRQIEASLLKAVAAARAKLEPARLFVGTGTSMANINRRARDVDGKISLGLNPEG